MLIDIRRYIPAIDSLRGYSWRTFGLDAMAGLTVATLAVPQAMAYALIAGVPPQYGLYTAIVMTAVGALFDSSRQLINGPTNAISIAILSALVAYEGQERVAAAILLAFLVGVIQTAITLLRLGDLTRYISHAVIIGFTVGASILLVLDQLKNLMGLRAQGRGDDHFLLRFWQTLVHVDETNSATLLIGLTTVGMAILLRLGNRHFRIHLPEMLLSVVIAAGLVWAFKLEERGVDVIGEIPARLPSFQLPEFDWSRMRSLSGSALAIALLGLLEALAMAKAIAARTQQKLDINQQCLSEGLANLTGSFFQCIPGSGSLTRSNINQQAGACTQWSGVISAAAVALTVVFLAPWAYYIPKSALAGILILSAYRMVDRKQLRYYLRTTRFDAGIVILTAVSAVAISIEFCILIGVFMSFILYVPQAARVYLTELTVTPERIVREKVPTDPTCGRIRIFSLEGELFFGAAPELEQHLQRIEEATKGGVRVVVLRVKRVRNPDAVCLSVLDRFITRMKSAGIVVLLCGVRPDLMKVIRASGLVQRVGPNHVFVFQETGAIWSATLEAIRVAYELIGEDVCEHCPRHATALNERRDWVYEI